MSLRRGLVLLASFLVALPLATCSGKEATSPAVETLDSPPLLGASSGSANYIHTFATAGTYPYHCTYHTTDHHRMAGTVIVADGAQDSAFVSIFEGEFQPSSVTVRPNGQVRWQNFDDGVHHTVTSD